METTRWGILGTGHIARKFAAGLQKTPGAELVAVGSRSLESAKKFLTDVGSPTATAHGSYQDLAKNEHVDVVYIASPNSEHKSNALLCLNGGRGVLVEKPFAINAAEAKEIIELAQSKNLFCMEAMWTRFSPAVAKLKKTLAAGAIGEVRMINASLGFFNEFNPNDRLFDPKLGGGSLLDLGVYPISFIMDLLGKPVSISSAATNYENGVDEQAAITFTFEDGEVAVATCSIRSGQHNSVMIYGDVGTIEMGPIYMPTWMKVTKFQRLIKPEPTGESSKGLIDRFRHIYVFNKAYGMFKQIINTSKMNIKIDGNGYNYEAIEAGQCIRAGLIESSLMTHSQTLEVMTVLDDIRADWGPPNQKSKK